MKRPTLLYQVQVLISEQKIFRKDVILFQIYKVCRIPKMSLLEKIRIIAKDEHESFSTS